MNLLVTRTFKDMETRGGRKQGTGDADNRSGLNPPIKVGREIKGRWTTQNLGVMFSKYATEILWITSAFKQPLGRLKCPRRFYIQLLRS